MGLWLAEYRPLGGGVGIGILAGIFVFNKFARSVILERAMKGESEREEIEVVCESENRSHVLRFALSLFLSLSQ